MAESYYSSMKHVRPQVDTATPLTVLFSRMEPESWDAAELSGPLLYVRGAKELHIPQRWRPLIPSAV